LTFSLIVFILTLARAISQCQKPSYMLH